jgi:hypothetical protein
VPTQCSREVEIVSPIDAPLLIVSTGWLPWRKHHVEAPALGDWAESSIPSLTAANWIASSAMALF